MTSALMGLLLLVVQTAGFAMDLATGVKWQVGTSVDFTDIDITNQEFNTSVLKGLVSMEHDSWRGFGLTFHYGTSLTDDSIDSITVDLAKYHALYITYEDYLANALLLKVHYGQSNVSLDTQLNSTDFPGKQSFKGKSWGASLSEHLKSFPKVKVIAGYWQLFDDAGVRLGTVSLGATYAF